MAWRIAGQHLRMLKVVRPLLQQQALMRQQLQQGRRLQLGSMQHPFLASYAAAAGKQQQQQQGGRRGQAGAGVGDGGVAAAGQLQGLTLL
jgi:hypothetical protein